MDTYITEEQQIEVIKNWWKENGISVITGTALGLAIVFGIRAWNDWRTGQSEAASQIYQQIMIGQKKTSPIVVQQAGTRLFEEYPNSIYAILGALAQAAGFIEKGDPASARGRLEWVILQSADPQIKALAQLRLGWLFLDQGDPERALTLSTTVASAGFPAEADELRGDVLRLQGDRKGALSAYQSAIAKLPPNSGRTTDLRMKIDDLGSDAG